MKIKLGPIQQFLLFSLVTLVVASTAAVEQIMRAPEYQPSRPAPAADAISVQYLSDKALEDAGKVLATKTRKEIGIGRMHTVSAEGGQYYYRIEDLSDTNDLSLCQITAVASVPDLKNPRKSRAVRTVMKKAGADEPANFAKDKPCAPSCGPDKQFTLVSKNEIPASY